MMMDPRTANDSHLAGMPCNRAVVGRGESRPPGLWTTGKLPKRMSGHDKADRAPYGAGQRGQRTEDTKILKSWLSNSTASPPPWP
jgi:hypothetical protein